MAIYRGLAGGMLSLLDSNGIEMIHETSLDILENIGIQIENQRAMDILHARGAVVDSGAKVIRFPRRMVLDMIEKAPSSVRLCGRDPRHDLVLEGKRVYIGSGGRPASVMDFETRKKRPAVLEDLVKAVRLIDALDNIHFCVIPLQPGDVPGDSWEVNNFYHALTNTTKHVMDGVSNRESLQKVIDLAALIAGGRDALRERPIISIITNALSPLKLDNQYVDILIDAALEKIPVTCAPAPIASSTAPVTLAGSLAQQNAESLAGLLVVQCASPGAPFLYGAAPATADLRTMNFLFGSVEMGMMNACAVQMAKYYNLPIYASAGVTDAKLPDAQAGCEKAMSTLMVAMAGGNYIHLAAGLVDGGLSVSLEQYVIDNDINGSVLRVLKNIEINRETLAYDVISNVGPGGNYLCEDHTVKYMRQEFFQPLVADRFNYPRWESTGRQDIVSRTKNKVEEILRDYQPVPLPVGVNDEILKTIPGLVLPDHEKTGTA